MFIALFFFAAALWFAVFLWPGVRRRRRHRLSHITLTLTQEVLSCR